MHQHLGKCDDARDFFLAFRHVVILALFTMFLVVVVVYSMPVVLSLAFFLVPVTLNTHQLDTMTLDLFAHYNLFIHQFLITGPLKIRFSITCWLLTLRLWSSSVGYCVSCTSTHFAIPQCNVMPAFILLYCSLILGPVPWSLTFHTTVPFPLRHVLISPLFVTVCEEELLLAWRLRKMSYFDGWREEERRRLEKRLREESTEREIVIQTNLWFSVILLAIEDRNHLIPRSGVLTLYCIYLSLFSEGKLSCFVWNLAFSYSSSLWTQPSFMCLLNQHVDRWTWQKHEWEYGGRFVAIRTINSSTWTGIV